MASYPFRNSMYAHGLEPRTIELIGYLIDHDQSWCDRDTVANALGWIECPYTPAHGEWTNAAICNARISFAFHYCQANAYLPRFGFYVERFSKGSGRNARDLYCIREIETEAA